MHHCRCNWNEKKKEFEETKNNVVIGSLVMLTVVWFNFSYGICRAAFSSFIIAVLNEMQEATDAMYIHIHGPTQSWSAIRYPHHIFVMFWHCLKPKIAGKCDIIRFCLFVRAIFFLVAGVLWWHNEKKAEKPKTK